MAKTNEITRKETNKFNFKTNKQGKKIINLTLEIQRYWTEY